MARFLAPLLLAALLPLAACGLPGADPDTVWTEGGENGFAFAGLPMEFCADNPSCISPGAPWPATSWPTDRAWSPSSGWIPFAAGDDPPDAPGVLPALVPAWPGWTAEILPAIVAASPADTTLATPALRPRAAATVPEPASLALLGAAMVALGLFRKF